MPRAWLGRIRRRLSRASRHRPGRPGPAGGRFLHATEGSYGRVAGPQLARAGVPPLGELRRSDLARFFRAPDLDRLYPAERLVPSFTETLAGLGIDLRDQANVTLDTERRPTKSPRAFCSHPRAPHEVYLVVAPVGGRDDFAALFHEGGHTEHYANIDPALPFEFRQLGDNSVTESFAFLLEHLVDDPEWLEARLGVADAAAAAAHSHAVQLYFLRRYAAKLAYELELHGPAPELDGMPARYAALLQSATRVRWSPASWLADVDAAFYVACYLRAWALETRWRAALRERFGRRWFESQEAALAALAMGAGSAAGRRRAARGDARGADRLRRDGRAVHPLEPLVHVGQDALAGLAAALLIANLAQVRRTQVAEPRLDLHRRELVVGGDR